MINAGVLFIFLISGMSGLIYQVIWVREFGQIFGSTVHSMALVTGIFMLGLGVGTYYAGILVDKKNASDPLVGLKYYAYSELAIGALGLLVGFTLPYLEQLSPLVSSYQKNDLGWYVLTSGSYIYRGAFAIILLAPITFLMGATLSCLIRYLLAINIDQPGWKISVLYMVNTVGAMTGCLMVDFVLVPNVGLQSTNLFAVSGNLIAGLVALKLIRNHTEMIPQPSVETNIAPIPIKFWLVIAAITVSGFGAMGMEIVWFRFLSSALTARREVFSLLLAVILAGIWLGSLLAGVLTRKIENKPFIYIVSQLLFVITTLASLVLFETPTDPHSWVPSIIAVVGVPALFMGFSFPTANAIIQNSFENVGRRAGLLYLFNTLGAVAGSWIVGFFLLPKFGMQNATTIVLIFSCLAVVPLLFFSGKVGLRRPLLAVPTATFVLVAVGLLSNWVGRPDHFMVQRSFKFNMNLKQWNIIRHVSEGINETAVVMETRFGRDRGSRTLYTNGHPMSGNSLFSQRYMRGFSHLPLLHLDQPKKVMVICFGVGNTIHSATLHPSVEKLELIDLSSNVLSLAGWFEATNKGVLRNSKLDIFVNDGRQHLRMGQGEDYDLVTLEPPPLQFAGVSSLYSYEFYQLVHRRLKEGGFLSQWLPINHIKADVAVSMVRAFLDVFPNAILFHGVNYNFILLGQKQEGKIQLSLDDLKRRLAERPEVWKDLIATDIPDVTSFFGMFAGGSDHLDRVSKGSRRLSDNRPIMEYDQIQPSRLGVDLLAPLNAKVWCPTCFSRKAARDELKDLKDYLKTMNTFYHADRYLTREAGDGTGKFEVALAPEGENRPDLVNIERLEELRKRYHYIKHFTDWVGMPVDIAKRKMEPK